MNLREYLKTEKAKERYDKNYSSIETTFSQKELEEHDREVRNKAIQDFYDKVLNFEDYIEPLDVSPLGTCLLYSPYDIKKMIVKIKEELTTQTAR